jgi:antibiotic biosynthesis monooxygenase (ABM) superfamily enzyme
MAGARIWPEPAEGEKMIARIWRGWAPQATAENYQRHYESEVTDHLRAVTGFCGARLLRREDGQEVMFTSITCFASLDAVRAFAGNDYEHAVVAETARQALSRWDEQVPPSRSGYRPAVTAVHHRRRHRGIE